MTSSMGSRELHVYRRDLFENIDDSTVDEIVIPGTSGKPNKVYRVVRGQIPQDLREAVVQDFTEYERHEIYHRVDVYQAECDHSVPKALWIFGPPAVGKTTICNEKAGEMFGWPDNAVTVDGSEFRTVHKGFQMVAQHGLRNHLLHEDAWKLLKGSGFMDALKEELVDHAMRNRQHLKIPETAISIERVKGMLRKLVAAGYELHAVCLWAPKSETEARGRPRGVKEGKSFTTKEYEKASRNALAFGKHWFDRINAGDPNYKSVMFYDNTVFPSHPVHCTEFEYLTNLSDDLADRHARACKAEKRAHEKSDIAASEARIKGSAPGQVVHAALAAFMSSNGHERRNGATMSDGDCISASDVIRDWSLSHADQVIAHFYAERRRGRVEGILTGLTLSASVAMLVRLYMSMRR